jgi:hypothetical protein
VESGLGRGEAVHHAARPQEGQVEGPAVVADHGGVAGDEGKEALEKGRLTRIVLEEDLCEGKLAVEDPTHGREEGYRAGAA